MDGDAADLGPGEPLDWEPFAAEIAAAARGLRARSGGRLVLVGHSLGAFKGRTAVPELAGNYPDVQFNVVSMNGHFSDKGKLGSLPDNVNVEHHTIVDDAYDMKYHSFRKMETQNGAEQYYYKPKQNQESLLDSYKRLYSDAQEGRLGQRLLDTHGIDKFHDAPKDTNASAPEPIDREVPFVRKSKSKRTTRQPPEQHDVETIENTEYRVDPMDPFKTR